MRIETFISGEAVEQLGGALILAGHDGSIIDVNRAALDCYGYTSPEMTSLDLSHIEGTGDSLAFVGKMRRAAEHGKVFRAEHRRCDGTLFPVEVRVAAVRLDERSALLAAIRDISERTQLEETMRNMVTAVIDVVDNVSEVRDPYTAGHQRRVAKIAVAIASDLGMSEVEIADIRVAALMHDIGKMSVPAEIPAKPTALSAVEFTLVKGHVEAGYTIISSAQMHDPIAELVYQHHERCDGSGYPRGLHSDELLTGSKVLMVADVVEAMMSHRPYRASLGQEAALAEIEQGAGRLYDASVADSCLRLFRERSFSLEDD